MGTGGRTRRWAAAVVVVASVALLAVGSLGVVALGAGGAGAATKPFDLVGTWEGPYRYPSPDGVVRESYQRLVIERQDGASVWGYDEFLDKDGQTVRIPVLGTVDGREFGLAEKSGFFSGRILARNRVAVRFFLVGDRPTSFHTVLTRRTS